MKKFLLTSVLFATTSAFAYDQTPVIEISSDSLNESTISLEQRVSRLEQQLTAHKNLQLAKQVADLQLKVRKLRDQLRQQKKLYGDVVDQHLSRSIDATFKSSPKKKVAAAKTLSSKSAYQAAYALVKQKRFSAAIRAMQAFIKKYPHHPLSANANYWLGELHMAKGQYRAAVSAFQTVIADFGHSHKRPHAMLKLGYAYAAMQQWSAASNQLKQVVQQYPGTSIASLAQRKLTHLTPA